MNPSSEDIFSFYKSRTSDALKRVKRPTDHFSILKGNYADSDSRMKAVQQSRCVSLACGPGCDLCCYLKVDVSAPEVFYIVDFLERRHARELPAIKERCALHARNILPLSYDQHLGSNHLCPLNLNGSCLAYDVRPLACRHFHAQNLQTCKYSYENPTELDSPSSQDFTMETVGKVISAGISAAYEDLGYDTNIYDLGAALHAALTNSKAFTRWRNKRTAFPIECRVKDANEVSSPGFNACGPLPTMTTMPVTTVSRLLTPDDIEEERQIEDRRIMYLDAILASLSTQQREQGYARLFAIAKHTINMLEPKLKQLKILEGIEELPPIYMIVLPSAEMRGNNGRVMAGVAWIDTGDIGLLDHLALAPDELISNIVIHECLHLVYHLTKPVRQLAVRVEIEAEYPADQHDEEEWVRRVETRICGAIPYLECWESAVVVYGDLWPRAYEIMKEQHRNHIMNEYSISLNSGLIGTTSNLLAGEIKSALEHEFGGKWKVALSPSDSFDAFDDLDPQLVHNFVTNVIENWTGWEDE